MLRQSTHAHTISDKIFSFFILHSLFTERLFRTNTSSIYQEIHLLDTLTWTATTIAFLCTQLPEREMVGNKNKNKNKSQVRSRSRS